MVGLALLGKNEIVKSFAIPKLMHKEWNRKNKSQQHVNSTSLEKHVSN